MKTAKLESDIIRLKADLPTQVEIPRGWALAVSPVHDGDLEVVPPEGVTTGFGCTIPRRSVVERSGGTYIPVRWWEEVREEQILFHPSVPVYGDGRLVSRIFGEVDLSPRAVPAEILVRGLKCDCGYGGYEGCYAHPSDGAAEKRDLLLRWIAEIGTPAAVSSLADPPSAAAAKPSA
jgi:hypothetical protein